MAWRDAAQDAMPPPRRSEPASLRSDILDELADHLALAAEREGRRQPEGEDTAWSRVLENFGDPAAIARRLWWDAMRETIMREWIQTGAIVIAAAVMVLFTGVTFRQMQASNQAVLEALRAEKTEAVDPTISYLDIEVRRGSLDGPPAEGVRVQLNGKFFRDEEVGLSEIIGDDARLSFGPFQQGKYEMQLYDDDHSLLSCQESILLFGGRKDLRIAAPPFAAVPTELRTSLPENANDDRVLILGRLSMSWDMQGEGNPWGASPNDLLIGKSGMYSLKSISLPRTTTRVTPISTMDAEDIPSWQTRLSPKAAYRYFRSQLLAELKLGAPTVTIRTMGIVVAEPTMQVNPNSPSYYYALDAASKLVEKYDYSTDEEMRETLFQEFPIEPGKENVITYEIPEPLRALYEREVRIQEIHAAQPDLSVEEVEAMVDGEEEEAEVGAE